MHTDGERQSDINEAPPPDSPKREWITSITGHDVRIEDQHTTNPSLGLFYRCEWSDPKDNICGRTWEKEYVFGEDSEMLLDYCRRHHKAIRKSIEKASNHNPSLDMDMVPTFYLSKATGEYNRAQQRKATPSKAPREADVDSDDDNSTQPPSQQYGERTQDELEQMFRDSGGTTSPLKNARKRKTANMPANDDDDEVPIQAEAVGTVTIKCGEITKKFDVDADGKLIKNVHDLGKDMGLIGNADMLLFTGRYMADREDGHFVVSQDILNAECVLTVTGQALEDSESAPRSDDGVPSSVYTAPYPDGTPNKFVLPHREVITHANH